MAKVGAQKAAELAGVSRWTITRRIAAGQLSCTRDNRRRPLIDLAELARAFDLDAGALARTVAEQRSVQRSVHQKPRNAPGAPVEADLAVDLRNRIDRLEADLAATRGELRDARAEVQTWAESYRRLSERLAVLAIEDRRQTPPTAPASRPATGEPPPHPEAGERSVRGLLADGVASVAAWLRPRG